MAIDRTRSAVDDETPNQRGSAREIDTGTGPVSVGGTSACTVVSEASSSGRPQPGQYTAEAGSGAPQAVQAASGALSSAALTCRFCPGFLGS